MQNEIGPGVGASFSVDRAPALEDCVIRHVGVLEVDVCNPDGSVREHHTIRNKLTNGGVNYMLNRAFFNSTSVPFAKVHTGTGDGTGWYLGLVETNPNPGTGFQDDDDMNNCLGVPGVPRWDDFANYNAASRALYQYGAGSPADLVELETRAASTIPATRAISNPTQLTIAITAGASVPVGGVYMINRADDTYSATTDILFSTANFASEPLVSSGDSLKITYTHSFGNSTDAS